MIVNYSYKNMTIKEFVDKFANAEIVGYGTIPFYDNDDMKAHPYIQLVGADDLFVLKFDDEIEDENKKGNNNMKRKFGTMPTKDELKFKKIIEQKDENKKIENLQAIISKNYKKIENQTKEITLLIQQKEELKATLGIANKKIEKRIDVIYNTFEELHQIIQTTQDKLNIANNTVALQIEENTKLNAKISHMDRIIESLSDEITRKDGVIAYLENKLELNK